VTTYTYDLAGNMLTMTDPDGNKTHWAYDNLNRVIQETECVGTSSQATRFYNYDLDGDLVQTTDYDGRVIQYVYDALGREIHENWMSGTTVVDSMTFTYDLAGELLSASDPASATDSYSYDRDGNCTSIVASYADGPTVTLDQSFDTNGYMTDLYAYVGQIADFHNNYAYDADGDVVAIAQTSNGGNGVSSKLVTFNYNDDGQMTGISRYAGSDAGVAPDPQSDPCVASTTYTYDDDSRMTGLTDTSNYSTYGYLAVYTWHYDADGRVATSSYGINDTGTDAYTSTYSYDSDSQLTGVTYSPSSFAPSTGESYSYDANGNRTGSGYSTGAGNRLLCDGTYHYEYDAEGNQIARWVQSTSNAGRTASAAGDTDVTLSTWDRRDRLTTVTTYAAYGDAVGQAIHYAYDPLNRRISESVSVNGGGGSPAWFVYDGQNMVLELNAAGLVAERYLWGPAVDQILAEENSSRDVLWPLTDNEGTVRDVLQFTPASGSNTAQSTIIDHIVYSGFGQIEDVQALTSAGAGYVPTISFQGQYWDAAAGSYYFVARWYNPTTVRYESLDPLGFSAGDPNPFRFVFNDSANLVDPTGEVPAPPPPTVPMLGAGPGAHRNQRRLSPGKSVDVAWSLFGWFDSLFSPSNRTPASKTPYVPAGRPPLGGPAFQASKLLIKARKTFPLNVKLQRQFLETAQGQAMRDGQKDLATEIGIILLDFP
jgi:RHS repeat-associated protein